MRKPTHLLTAASSLAHLHIFSTLPYYKHTKRSNTNIFRYDRSVLTKKCTISNITTHTHTHKEKRTQYTTISKNALLKTIEQQIPSKVAMSRLVCEQLIYAISRCIAVDEVRQTRHIRRKENNNKQNTHTKRQPKKQKHYRKAHTWERSNRRSQLRHLPCCWRGPPDTTDSAKIK